MTDYTMPVLSEQEKLVLIDNAMVFLTRVKYGNLEASKFDVYQAQIALAALMSEPIDPADCFCQVYLAPPVPVKQEGEQ